MAGLIPDERKPAEEVDAKRLETLRQDAFELLMTLAEAIGFASTEVMAVIDRPDVTRRLFATHGIEDLCRRINTASQFANELLRWAEHGVLTNERKPKA